ncbi:gluconate transporter, partial [Pseudomonas syringae]
RSALVAEAGAAAGIGAALTRRGKGPLGRGRMALVAMGIGLPRFFAVGLVLMVPIIFVMARPSGQPRLKIAIPALAGMTTLPALMPPHPGPLIAVSAFHADLGLTMLVGLCIAVPAVILAGPLYCNWLPGRMHAAEPAEPGALFRAKPQTSRPPGFGISPLTLPLPVIR